MRRLFIRFAFVLVAIMCAGNVGATPPMITLTSPSPDAVITEALTPTVLLQASVAGTDAPIHDVVFYVCVLKYGICNFGDTSQFTVSEPPYEVQWTPPRVAPQPDGPVPFQAWASATNTLGQQRTTSVTHFSVLQPPDPPSISLVTPRVEGGYVTPTSPVLFAMASPGNTIPPSTIARVDFLDGGVVIGTVAAPNSVPTGYGYVWTNAPPGMHLISARVTDSLGYSTTSSAVSIYIIGPDPPPTVILTAPVTGQLFAPPNAVPLAATATSPLGTIQRVEFVAADKVIGTVFSPPYVGSWANPPAGTFAVVAKAYDDVGVAATSPAAYIQVLPAPRTPVVVITGPASGATFASGTPLSMAATALAPDGNIGRVDFYAGTTLLGSSSTAPFQFTWSSPAAGPQSLSARAYDLQGNFGKSSSVPVTVATRLPPLANLTAPAANSVYAAPATIAMSATASASDASIAKVDFYSNGSLVGTSSSAPYRATWNNASAGSYALSARATDTQGATGTSPTISVVVSANQPPLVSLTAPANAQTFFTGQSISFGATASDSDGTVTRVDFLVDGIVVGSAPTAPFAMAWTGATAGPHIVSARATDNLGATTMSAGTTIAVTANSAPTVALALLHDGQTFAAGAPISLSAVAADADGSIARVEFYADAVLVATATAAPYAASWSGASPGTRSITAKAIDDRGASTTSAAVVVQVVELALAIASPGPSASIAADFVTVSGTYSAPGNSGVTVNGITANSDGQGHYFASNVPLNDGVNTLTVILTTQRGQNLTQTQSVTRSSVAPMRIYVDPDADVAPATFTLRVENRTTNAIASVSFEDLGGGLVDASMLDQATIAKISYATPGIYRPTLVITDVEGNTYLQSVAILSLDKAMLDQTLMAVWGEFSNALATGDKNTAIQTLSSSAQFKYARVFDALLADLPTILSTWSVPAVGTLTNEFAEYAVRRNVGGVNRAFLIYLTRGLDGVWRIDSM